MSPVCEQNVSKCIDLPYNKIYTRQVSNIYSEFRFVPANMVSQWWVAGLYILFVPKALIKQSARSWKWFTDNDVVFVESVKMDLNFSNQWLYTYQRKCIFHIHRRRMFQCFRVRKIWKCLKHNRLTEQDDAILTHRVITYNLLLSQSEDSQGMIRLTHWWKPFSPRQNIDDK